jgi:NADPH:quinone reductase-like Zn-dependent oxidoreductase
VVEICEVDRPIPVLDQVLVRVRAASVNRADLDNLYPRWRFLRLFLGLRAPRNHRLGSDVAGIVEAVGPRVARVRPGDRVFGDLFPFGGGAFAEAVCAPERAFAVMPDGMSFEDAATLPHSAVLAIQGLRRRSGRTVSSRDRVLISGASGNVGSFAVQIAHARGAHVTGVASTPKLDFVRSLGADAVIDYRLVDPTRTGETYDWILDVDAHHPVRRWQQALRPGGTYVALGGSAGWFLTALVQGPVLSLAARKQMGIMLWWRPFRLEDVAALTSLVAQGRLKPAVDRTYPLDEVVGALRRVDEGRARGKVVITA